jgi:hypothetical protein
MREEAVHISQLAEGEDIAKKVALLTEKNLSKWPQMSMEQRLDIYKAKVEVEIDAQQRLLKQFGEGDPQYVKGVQHNLENLRARMAEVEVGVKNPQSVKDADWLQEAEAPRLFSKDPVSPGKVVVTEEAKKFAAKSLQEAQKLENLEQSANALSLRGFDVKVEGEGVIGGGELVISRKGLGINIQAESKRLISNTPRAVQTAIEKGTKQVGDGGTIIIDGTSANVTEDIFEEGLGKFKNLVLPKRAEQNKAGQSGQIIFLYGEKGEKIIKF